MSSKLPSFVGRLTDRLRSFSLASWWRTSNLAVWWCERSIWGKIGWPLLAYIVVFSMFSDGTHGSARSTDIGRATSIRACQDAVRERLKAPSTAESSGESYQAPQSHKRVVTGDVDAQNSFVPCSGTPGSVHTQAGGPRLVRGRRDDPLTAPVPANSLTI